MSNTAAPTRICPVCGSSRTHVFDGTGLCFACEAEFEPQGPAPAPRTAVGPTDHPRKLFLSCSPSEGEVGQKIREALARRGHTVWTVPEKLPTGMSRRQFLAKGLASSQGIVACLSRRSVRDPGDCLEDLALALGTCDSLQTILLEPESLVNPPPTLCSTQWLDMSDWKDREAEGEEAFRSWFEERMGQLILAVENPETPILGGEIAEVKKRLLLSVSEGRERDLLGQVFTGRAWLDSQINAWLDDPEGPSVCLLYGAPGVGKSAFAAHLLHTNPRAAGGVFCESGNPCCNMTSMLWRTIAYLLACRVPEYRLALLLATGSTEYFMDECYEDPLENLFSLPMKDFMPETPRDTLCLVFDGLEECHLAQQKAIGEMLEEFMKVLPSWLRLLITAPRKTAFQKRFPDALRVELPRAGKENRADMKAYFQEVLGERFGKDPAWPAALVALGKSGNGNFLCATLTAEGLLSGSLLLNDTAVFPKTLPQAFQSWFTWNFPDLREYKEVWRPALEMLLAWLDPLPLAELGRVLGWDEARRNDFLRRMGPLLRRETNDFGEETLIFRHAALEEWLRDNPDSEYCGVRGEAGMERMAVAFSRLADPSAGSLTAYESLYFTGFLQEIGKSKESRKHFLRPDLFLRLIYWGDLCVVRGKPDAAEQCRSLSGHMAACMADQRETEEDLLLDAMSMEREGVLANLRGAHDREHSVFTQAIEVRTDLTYLLTTGRPQNRLALSILHAHLADSMQKDGLFSMAQQYRRMAMGIREALAQEEPSPRLTLYLSFSQRKLGESLLPEAEGLDYLKKSTALARQVVDCDPAQANLEYLTDCLSCLLFHLLREGKTREGLELYRKHEPILRDLLPETSTPLTRKAAGGMYLRLSHILRESGETRAEALELARKALAMDEEQVRTNPIPENLRDLATSLQAVGEALEFSEDPEAALASYRRAAAIRETLAKSQRAPELRIGLGNSWECVAKILAEYEGKYEEALELCRKNVALREQLAEEIPTPERRQYLCDIWDLTGQILFLLNRLDESLTFYRKGTALAEGAGKNDSAPEIRDALSHRYINIGSILNQQGKDEEALESYLKGRAVSSTLVKADENPEYRETLVYALRKIVENLDNRARAEEALKYCKEAMRHAMILAKKQNTLEHRELVNAVGTQTAATLSTMGRYDQALKISREVLKSYEQMVQEPPSPEHVEAYTNTCFLIGGTLLAQGRNKEAFPVYQKAKSLADRLAREDPSLANRDRAARTAVGIAHMLEFDGKTDEALKLFQEVLRLREEIAKEDPSPEQKSELASSQEDVARNLDDQERFQEAMDLYRKAEWTWAQLVRDDPSPENRRNQAVNLRNMGDNLTKQDKAVEAISCYEKSIAMLCEVIRTHPLPLYRMDLSTACASLGIALVFSGQNRKRGTQLLKESEKSLADLYQEDPRIEYSQTLEQIRMFLEQL